MRAVFPISHTNEHRLHIIFFLGGAISNLYAVAVARHKMMPDTKAKGLSSAPRLVLYTSEMVQAYCYHLAIIELSAFDVKNRFTVSISADWWDNYIFDERHGVERYESHFKIISCIIFKFSERFVIPSTWHNWGWGYRMFGCPSVWPSVRLPTGRPSVRPAIRLSTFRFRSRSRKPLDGSLQFCTHTSLRM